MTLEQWKVVSMRFGMVMTLVGFVVLCLLLVAQLTRLVPGQPSLPVVISVVVAGFVLLTFGRRRAR